MGGDGTSGGELFPGDRRKRERVSGSYGEKGSDRPVEKDDGNRRPTGSTGKRGRILVEDGRKARVLEATISRRE